MKDNKIEKKEQYCISCNKYVCMYETTENDSLFVCVGCYNTSKIKPEYIEKV